MSIARVLVLLATVASCSGVQVLPWNSREMPMLAIGGIPSESNCHLWCTNYNCVALAYNPQWQKSWSGLIKGCRLFGCPTGWTLHAGRCHRISRKRVSLSEAQTRCRQLPQATLSTTLALGELTLPGSDAEDAFLARLAKAAGESKVWIGLRHLPAYREFEFRNMTGGAFSYMAWRGDEPNGDQATELGVVLGTGQVWYDVGAQESYAFACSYGPDNCDREKFGIHCP